MSVPTSLEVVTNFLRSQADGLPVVTKVPMQRPGVFVVVTNPALHRHNLITDRALVIVQVYAPTRGQAVDLIGRLREALIDIDAHIDGVFGWQEQAGPVEFADPDCPEIARYQLSGYLLQALA